MRIISVVNMIGVLALAMLCAAQWETNRRVNLEAVRLDGVRQEQARKIGEQDREIRGCNADLDDFRRWIEQSGAALLSAEANAASLRTERDRAAAERDAARLERDHLAAEREKDKATLEKWMAAVSQRDEAIKKGNDEIQKLAKERNDAVMKFNELAGKYNGLVKDLNDARAKPAGGH